MKNRVMTSIGLALLGAAFVGAQPQLSNRVPMGEGPEAVIFDGANLWVTNEFDNTVTRMSPTGALLGTHRVGRRPLGLATDGRNLWVANYLDDTVSHVSVDTGAVIATYPVGAGPVAVTHHRGSVWVANRDDNTVTRLDAATGQLQATVKVGRRPNGLVAGDVAVAGNTAHFVWVANSRGGTVSRIRQGDNTVAGTFPVGDGPFGVAFDGSTVWVSNYFSQNVTRLAADGKVIGTYATGDGASGILFDGDSVWVANNGSNSVSRLRATDGALLQTVSAGKGPFGLAFDGAAIWVANFGSNDVMPMANVKPSRTVPNGLVLGLGFNEQGGPVAFDASPAGNSGTVSGATRVRGKDGFGGALSFNGATNVVGVPGSPSVALTSAMTLEAWVNPSSVTGWRTVLLKEGATAMAYELYANNADVSRAAAYYTTPAGALRGITGTSPIAVNTWTHLAATYDGTTMKFYVNGAVVRSVLRAGAIDTTSGPLNVGGNFVWGGEYFAGLIDDVRVYNRALSDAEVARDMITSLP
jgi:YVTN family beta-propeller protein